MVIGGVAVIAHGVPRLTVDIDATVVATGLDPRSVTAALAGHGIHDRIPDAEAFARAHHVLLCAHQASGTPIDLTFAWLPFEEDAVRASETCDYAGVTIKIPRPEDLLVYKIVASRPRDIDDAEALLTLHGSRMDLDRVRRIIGEFAAALEDVERPAILERLIQRTIGQG